VKSKVLKAAVALAVVALASRASFAQTPVIVPIAGTTTRDIPFTSHDGHSMVGRLTLPDTPGPHPILMLVPTAEAHPIDGEIRPVRRPTSPPDDRRRASPRSSHS
jgi:hypothetical protein